MLHEQGDINFHVSDVLACNVPGAGATERGAIYVLAIDLCGINFFWEGECVSNISICKWMVGAYVNCMGTIVACVLVGSRFIGDLCSGPNCLSGAKSRGNVVSYRCIMVACDGRSWLTEGV